MTRAEETAFEIQELREHVRMLQVVVASLEEESAACFDAINDLECDIERAHRSEAAMLDRLNEYREQVKRWSEMFVRLPR